MTDTLTGSERGCWMVTSQGATYRFDLDAMTVIRFPGPGSRSTVNDQTRPLMKIVQCMVGKRGFWLMEPEGLESMFLEYYWTLSSRIISIDRQPAGREQR